MSTRITYAFGFALVTFLLGYVVSDLVHKYANEAEASVGWGNEYNASLINVNTASGTAMTVYKTGYGSIGQITVASSSAAVANYPLLTIYDASSTMATSSARKIGVFQGTVNTGTYTFDAVVTNGVAVEVPVGFTGAYTITWR